MASLISDEESPKAKCEVTSNTILGGDHLRCQLFSTSADVFGLGF